MTARRRPPPARPGAPTGRTVRPVAVTLKYLSLVAVCVVVLLPLVAVAADLAQDAAEADGRAAAPSRCRTTGSTSATT